MWSYPAERRAEIQELVAAWERGDKQAIDRLILRLDDEIVKLLLTERLQRGYVKDIRPGSFERGWSGRKTEDCSLLLNLPTIRAKVQVDTADDVLRTWVHESLHARAPYADGHQIEISRTPGYEEGLVEGLA